MGVGPNFVLDKAHKATGATAYARAELVTPTNTGLDVVRATVTPVTTVLYVCMEDLDAVRLATGKAFINCRILGIARVKAGATFAVWSRVTNDATARAVGVARTAAGSQPVVVAGIALQAATVVGQEVDVLLTPGATW